MDTPASAPSSATRIALRVWCIDPLEVVEHRAPLVRRQAAQLAPARLPEALRRRPVHGGPVVDHGVITANLGFPLPGILALILLQREARVAQSMKESLLPIQQLLIHAAAIQRCRDLPHLPGQLGGTRFPAVAGV